MNNIETIDGITGEWRTVTKASEVTVGQRVRYDIKTSFSFEQFGYEKGNNRLVKSINKGVVETAGEKNKKFGVEDLFDGKMINIQAFFPLADKQKRKVAKVSIGHNSKYHWFEISQVMGAEVLGNYVESRKSALRGARRFCKAIGYEMEVVK